MADAVPGPALRRNPSRRVGCLLASLSTALVVLLVGALLTYPLWMSQISGFFSPWPESPSPTALDLTSVAMVSATDGWAVGENGTILHYGGSKWTPVNSPTESNLSSVVMVSATEGWAVGNMSGGENDGTILHYVGGHWRTVASTPNALIGIAMMSATDGWAVGDGVILHYNGGNWTQVGDPSSSVLASVAMVSATDGWVVGWTGTILHYGSGT